MDNLIKEFTDQELIQELRNRNYALSIWSISDVDQAIDDLKEHEPEEYANLELSEDDKADILTDLFEDNDKSDDNEMITEKVIEKFNYRNKTK